MVLGVVGEPVEVADSAKITIRFASSWKAHASSLAGYRYVVLDLSVEATGDSSMALMPDSFRLVDETGRPYSPIAKGAGPEIGLPTSVLHGDTLSGKLTFEIPAGGNYTFVFYSDPAGPIAKIDVTRAVAAIPTPPIPTAKPRPTTKPTSPPVSNGSGSGTAGGSAARANEYIDSVLNLYGFALRSRTLELAYAEGCSTPGASAEMCAASIEAWKPRVAEVRRLISDHLAFMKSHPAATCFRDAYAVDRPLAQDYLAWVGNWRPMGTTMSSEARFQYYAWQDLDYRAGQFLDGMNAYFKDCR